MRLPGSCGRVGGPARFKRECDGQAPAAPSGPLPLAWHLHRQPAGRDPQRLMVTRAGPVMGRHGERRLSSPCGGRGRHRQTSADREARAAIARPPAPLGTPRRGHARPQTYVVSYHGAKVLQHQDGDRTAPASSLASRRRYRLYAAAYSRFMARCPRPPDSECGRLSSGPASR